MKRKFWHTKAQLKKMNSERLFDIWYYFGLGHSENSGWWTPRKESCYSLVNNILRNGGL